MIAQPGQGPGLWQYSFPRIKGYNSRASIAERLWHHSGKGVMTAQPGPRLGYDSTPCHASRPEPRRRLWQHSLHHVVGYEPTACTPSSVMTAQPAMCLGLWLHKQQRGVGYDITSFNAAWVMRALATMRSGLWQHKQQHCVGNNTA